MGKINFGYNFFFCYYFLASFEKDERKLLDLALEKIFIVINSNHYLEIV